MSAFFTRFVAGGALAAGVTYYYHLDINATAAQLRSDLHDLSHQLVASAPKEGVATPRLYPEVPARVGVTESVKARWNETVQGSVRFLQTTDWTQVAVTSWEHGKMAAGQLKEKLAPAPEPTTGPDAPKVV